MTKPIHPNAADEELARAVRRGFGVVAALVVLAICCGTFAAYGIVTRPLALAPILEPLSDPFGHREAAMIARAQSIEFQGDPEMPYPFPGQDDVTDRALKAQPGLEKLLVDYATRNLERFGGAPLSEMNALGKPQSATLLGIGLPGSPGSDGDAYVMFSHGSSDSDAQAVRISLTGPIGGLKPGRGNADVNLVSGASTDTPEEYCWPDWVQELLNATRTPGSFGAQVPDSIDTSHDAGEPAQTRATTRILREQPGLDAKILKAVRVRLKDSDFKFIDGSDPKQRFTQSVKLAGIARDGKRVDAYVYAIRTDESADDPAFMNDMVAFRVSLKGEPGDYRVGDIVNGEEIIGDTAYAESTSWPVFVDIEMANELDAAF